MILLSFTLSYCHKQKDNNEQESSVKTELLDSLPIQRMIALATSETTILYPTSSISGTSTLFTNFDNYVLANITLANNEINTLNLYKSTTDNHYHIGAFDGISYTSFGTYEYNSNYTWTYTRSWYAEIIINGSVEWQQVILGGGVSWSGSTFFTTSRPSATDFDTFVVVGEYQLDGAYYQGYDEGVKTGKQLGQTEILQDISNDPGAYGYVTLNDYESYGALKYTEGKTDGTEYATEFSIPNLIFSILSAPSKIIEGAFNWEIFGINVSQVIFFVIGVAIVVFIVRLFIGGKS